MSKIAVNMAFRSFAQEVKDKGIAVAILHPGMVQTEMLAGIQNPQMIQVEESVNGLYQRMEELNIENTGSFWHQNGTILNW